MENNSFESLKFHVLDLDERVDLLDEQIRYLVSRGSCKIDFYELDDQTTTGGEIALCNVTESKEQNVALILFVTESSTSGQSTSITHSLSVNDETIYSESVNVGGSDTQSIMITKTKFQSGVNSIKYLSTLGTNLNLKDISLLILKGS